jgi:hypothetical protein
MNSHKRNLSAEKRINDMFARLKAIGEHPECEGCPFMRMCVICRECVLAEVVFLLMQGLKPEVKE